MAKSIDLMGDYIQNDDEIIDVIVETTEGKAEEIKKSEIVNYKPENIKKIIPMPMTQDIIDGSSTVATKYLQKEFPYMAEFFKSRGVTNPDLQLDLSLNNEWYITVNFPIPKRIKLKDGTYYQRDPNIPVEKFLFLINDYPNMPPVGFHVSKNAHKNMISALENAFGAHRFDKVMISGVDEKAIDEVAQKFSWICFHYGKDKWKFDRSFWENTSDKKTVSKSSLTGYFYYIFYKMTGAFDVSS